MAGIAVLFILLRAESPADAGGKALGDLQEGIAARGLMPGYGGLRQMAEAVELMVVLQIGEGFVPAVEDVIGIQVPVLRLGIGNEPE
jgi:hypothetical protein